MGQIDLNCKFFEREMFICINIFGINDLKSFMWLETKPTEKKKNIYIYKCVCVCVGVCVCVCVCAYNLIREISEM